MIPRRSNVKVKSPELRLYSTNNGGFKLWNVKREKILERWASDTTVCQAASRLLALNGSQHASK